MRIVAILCLLSVCIGAPCSAQVVLTDRALVHRDPVALFGLTDPGDNGVRPTKPIAEVEYPYLPDEPDGRSFSVGTVTDGWVVNAIALPQPGATYGILPRQLQRGLNWGSQELIATLIDASERVARDFPGAILWFGNIGARGGGDIPYSVSHNAGRDADLAFYCTDPAGNPIAPPDLLHFGRSGRSVEYGGYYRFDVPRNWALVRALVRSPHAQLQYLFISNPLRTLLLDHARAIGEDPALVSLASRVLYQPGPEIPHDDHLHVRLHCSRADLAAGCVETGPAPAAPVDRGAIIAARTALAASLLRNGESLTRARAVRRLALLGAAGQLEAIRGRLADPSPFVRGVAVDAIAELGGAGHLAWLTDHWEEETDDAVRERLLLATGELGGAAAVDWLQRRLAGPLPAVVRGKQYDLRLAAIQAAVRLRSTRLAGALVACVEDADPAVATAAIAALRELANAAIDGVDPWDLSPDLPAAAAAWRQWLASAGDDRRQWLDAGFAAAGYGTWGPARDVAAELARAAGDERPWIRRNAQRELMRMTGNTPRSLDWSPGDAATYWTRWVRRNPSRIGAR